MNDETKELAGGPRLAPGICDAIAPRIASAAADAEARPFQIASCRCVPASKFEMCQFYTMHHVEGVFLPLVYVDCLIICVTIIGRGVEISSFAAPPSVAGASFRCGYAGGKYPAPTPPPSSLLPPSPLFSLPLIEIYFIERYFSSCCCHQESALRTSLHS
jgi:hypothetical protein